MAAIKSVFFDQDGVIIDTERDGHRVAFNQTFQDFGFDIEWGVDFYHEMLQVAGGKERMTHYFVQNGMEDKITPELIKKMHKHKTNLFVKLIESGKPPLRSGVKRLMREVNNAGLILGICTTSTERAAQAVVQAMLSEIKFDFVLAGDVVKKKKPNPEIYQLARQKSGLQPHECLVIEDSRQGVLSARAAGMHVVATTNPYTEKEDLSDADIIITALGDEGREKGELVKGGEGMDYEGVLRLGQLQALFG